MSLLKLRFVICVTLSIFLSQSVAAGGRAANDEQTTLSAMKIVVHHRSSTCGGLTQSQWLPNQQVYESTYKALFQNLISDSKPDPAIINFASHAMLLVSMGQQRTGGYAVKLASDQLQLENHRAKISVDWVHPPAGMMTIQMMTNPCLLLQIPRQDYQFVDIVDQSGKVRQTISSK